MSLFLLFIFCVLSPVLSTHLRASSLTCDEIIDFVVTEHILLYPETRARLQRYCPSAHSKDFSGAIVRDGIVETLLNRLDKTPCNGEELKVLRGLSMNCDGIPNEEFVNPYK